MLNLPASQPAQPPTPMRERQPTSSSIEVNIANESGNTRFPSLTPGEARAAEQLLTYFDHNQPGSVVGLIGPRSCGKSTLLTTLLAPVSGRRVRTAEHRKVVGLLLDAGAAKLPDGKSAWQFLVLNVLDLLASHAMPTERKSVNELRSELLRVMRPSARTDGDNRLAVAAFAHHFRTAFPRLVMNVFTLSNAVLVVGIDHLEHAPANQVAEWLEAANYFISAPGCTVVISADDAALSAKLGQSAGQGAGHTDQSDSGSAKGDALLRKWLPRRVKIDVLVAPIPAPAPARPSPIAAGMEARAETRTLDIPPACMQIITTALQPDRRLINVAVANWHEAMHVIVKRAEDRTGNAISSTVIAKLVTIQALSPQLFDAGRYNAQLLVTLERQLRNEAPAPAEDAWHGAVSQHAQLKALLTSNPLLSALSLRDVATALRLAYAGQDVDSRRALDTATAVITPGAKAETPRDTARDTARDTPRELSSGTAQHTDAKAPSTQTDSRAAVQPIVLGLPAWVSAIVAGGVFAVDRLAKLLMIAAQPSALYGNGAGVTATSGAFAVSAELFGIALCVLILVFWGGTRSQRLYSASLGCILGALASNLFDRLVYGNVLNFIHIAGLPVFNLSHMALLAGAVLLAVSLVRNSFGREVQPQS